MENVENILKSIKQNDYTYATDLMKSMLSQKALEAINKHTEYVGQQMLGQTSTEQETEDEIVDETENEQE